MQKHVTNIPGASAYGRNVPLLMAVMAAFSKAEESFRGVTDPRTSRHADHKLSRQRMSGELGSLRLTRRPLTAKDR